MLIELSKPFEIRCPSTEICSETTPLIEVRHFNVIFFELNVKFKIFQTSKSNQRKTKKKDCYERLAEDIQTMTMNCNDSERQVK